MRACGFHMKADLFFLQAGLTLQEFEALSLGILVHSSIFWFFPFFLLIFYVFRLSFIYLDKTNFNL